jgi:hypothetical protein
MKTRHDIQLSLVPADPAPPVPPKGPVTRRKAETANEPEFWVARLAEMLEVPAPQAPERVRLQYEYIGPSVEPCGTEHKPMYDAEYHDIVCAVCKTKLTQRIKD